MVPTCSTPNTRRRPSRSVEHAAGSHAKMPGPDGPGTCYGWGVEEFGGSGGGVALGTGTEARATPTSVAGASTARLELAAHHTFGVLGCSGDDLVGLLLVDPTGFDGIGRTLFGVGDEGIDQILGIDALLGGDISQGLATPEGLSEFLGLEAEDLGDLASTGRAAPTEVAVATATVAGAFGSGRFEGACDGIDLALGEGAVVYQRLESLGDVSAELSACSLAGFVGTFLGTGRTGYEQCGTGGDAAEGGRCNGGCCEGLLHGTSAPWGIGWCLSGIHHLNLR